MCSPVVVSLKSTLWVTPWLMILTLSFLAAWSRVGVVVVVVVVWAVAVDVGLGRVVVDRAGGVDAGLEDQVGEGEDDCRVLVWEAGLGSSWSPRGPRSSWTWRG